MVLEKTLKSPLDGKEIRPEYSLEGLMLKLQLQYVGHLMQRADSLEKTLMLAKTEGRRRRRQEDEMVRWHHQLKGHEFEQTPGESKGQGSLACCSITRLNNDNLCYTMIIIILSGLCLLMFYFK